MLELLRRTTVLLFALTAITACTGADGPMGPQGETGAQGEAGPQGPAGPPGTGARATYLVELDEDGYGEQGLPLSFGTNPSIPPLLACYVTDVPSEGAWQPIADGFAGAERAVCALIFDEGRWFAVLIDGPPEWTVAFSVLGG